MTSLVPFAKSFERVTHLAEQAILPVMTDKKTDELLRRKGDHIDVVLGGNVDFGYLTTGFEVVQFEHQALPELALDEIDLSCSFLGKPLNAPLLISSMTGGPARAEAINEHLCVAAEELGIALGIGSQRIALEDSGDYGLSNALRQKAPTIPLLGNIGGAQLRDEKSVMRVRKALEMIDADALFIHLNPLQEAVQDGGDSDWRGVLSGIESVVAAGLPVILKEVGFGLSARTIAQLSDVGVTMFDVAGAGGTNWARVEGGRSSSAQHQAIAKAFTEWGIPTASAVNDARAMAPHATIIASGGIKNGVDAAKAIRLGADLVGQAAATLAAATQSEQAVIDHFNAVIETMRIVCFCTGSKNLSELKEAPLLSARP